nr:NAD(P)-binding domain-containing protein [Actinocatenispora comari]
MHSNQMQPVVIVGAGQAGLAAAGAVRAAGAEPVLMEAGSDAVGSWPHFYDSLTLFSPARYSALPGAGFDGDPDRYPHRDEVVDYLRGYAKRLDVDIRYGQRVEQVVARPGGFAVRTVDGQEIAARRVIAASGGFGTPYRPHIPALEGFGGQGSARRRLPRPATVRRAAGGGGRCRQLGDPDRHRACSLLAGHDRLAAPDPVPAAARRRPRHALLADGDPAGHRALGAASADRRDRYAGVRHRQLRGRDRRGQPGSAVDVHPLRGAGPDLRRRPARARRHGAAGHRVPARRGLPRRAGVSMRTAYLRHRGGLSSTHPGLGYVGLEWQRSFSSATLRGVGRDAAHVVRQLDRQTSR